MGMSSSSNTLPFFVKYNLRIPLAQELLFIFEYIPLLLGTISAPIKLHYYYLNSIKEFSPSVLFQLVFPVKLPSIKSQIIVISILFILQFIYYIMTIFVINKTSSHSLIIKIVFWIFSGFYDIFYFRLGSFYVIYLYSNTLIISLNLSTAAHIAISMITFIILMWYVIQLLLHIHYNSVMFHFKNKAISNGILNYPYDWNFSRKFDISMILLKLFISIENAYFINSAVRNRFILVLFDSAIILFAFCYFVYILFNFIIQIKLEWMAFNRELIILRFGFITFLGYNLILTFCFLRSNSSNELIIIIVIIALLWTIAILIYVWSYRISPHLYNGKFSIKKLVLASMDINPSALFQIDAVKLLSSFDITIKSMNCKIIHDKSKMTTNKQTTSIENINLLQIFEIFNFSLKHYNGFITDKIDQIYCDILKLLQFYSKGKLFKYFSYYNSFLKKYSNDKIIINNLHLLVKASLSSLDELIGFYNDILTDTQLNKQINTILDSFAFLLITPKELLKFTTLLSISEDINNLKLNSKYLIINIVSNANDKMAKDESLKNLKNVYRYFLVIHRYIVESITNESLSPTHPIDIEGMEDYLSKHYSNDKSLLLSLNLNSITLNQEKFPCTILECGKDLIKYKSKNLSQIFPKQFRRECVKAFTQKLLYYIETSICFLENTDKNNNVFETIISSPVSLYVELFRYSFKIIPSIINNDIIINGIYSTNDSNIVIFKKEGRKDLHLETFSSLLNNVIIITPEWLQYLKSIKVDLPMRIIFSKYAQINDNDYECDMTYSQLYNLYMTYPYYDNDNGAFTKSKYNELKAKLENIKESKDKPVQLYLRLLFEIKQRETYRIYSIIASKTLKKMDQTQYSQDNDQKDNCDYFSLNLMNTTNSSMSGSSVQSLSKEFKKKNLISNEDNQVNLISKQFSWFSRVIILFNTLMVGLCFLFLILLIFQSRKLSAVNKMYYKFQTIRITFANTFLNVFANVCVAKYNSNECNNGYNDFSEELHNLQNLDPKHSIRALIVNAIKYKINGLQTQYNAYKDMVHTFGNRDFEKILQIKMTYINIGIQNNKLVQENIVITLEEGIRKFINSLAILDSSETDFDSAEFPIHIITIKQNKVDFSNIFDHNLNDIQREIYKVCINYIYYSSGYLNGETQLHTAFLKISSSNKSILYTYIILLAILHFVLAILCRWIIVIVETLLISFVIQISTLITKEEYKEYLITKIDTLMILNELYTQNPNHLIKIIKKKKREIMTNRSLKTNNNNQQTSKATPQGNIKLEEEKELIEEGKEIKAIDRSEVKSILFPFVKQMYIVFVFYFFCLIIFDKFLIDSFTRVMLSNDYVLANVNLENQIYNNVALLQVVTLLNLTQEELIRSIGKQNPEPDGILNMKIRETLQYQQAFFQLEREYPHLFPPISSYFENKCEPIFEKTRDKITTFLGELLGVDYIPFQIEMCYRYKSLSLPNFEFNYIDHNFRCQLMQNYIGSNSYDDLYSFNQRLEFFDLYTFTLIAVRPIRAYITDQILYNLIDTALNNFISIVSGYLCYNILADLLIFLIIQIFTLKKIKTIHQNLQTLRKCLYVKNTMIKK